MYRPQRIARILHAIFARNYLGCDARQPGSSLSLSRT
jgi:hypothetical protein